MMKNHFSLPLLILIHLSGPGAYAQGINNIPGDLADLTGDDGVTSENVVQSNPTASSESSASTSTKSVTKREVRVEVRKNWESYKQNYQKAMTDFYGLAYDAQYKADQYELKKSAAVTEAKTAEQDALQAEAASEAAQKALEKRQKDLDALKAKVPSRKLEGDYDKTNAFLEQERQRKIAALTTEVAGLDTAAKSADESAKTLRLKSEALKGDPDTKPEVRAAKEEMTAAKTAYEAGKTSVKTAETELSQHADDAKFAGGIQETRGGWLFGGRNKTKKLLKETNNLSSTVGSLQNDSKAAAEAKFLEKHGLTVAPDIRKLEPKPNPTQPPVTPSVAVVIPSADEIQKMDITGIQKLTPEQIKGMTPSAIVAMNQDRIQALNQKQIEALTDKQIQALSKDKIAQFCDSQVPFFTSEQIAVLNDEQLIALNEIQPLSGEKLTDAQKALLAKAADDKKKGQEKQQKETCDIAAAALAKIMMEEKGQKPFSDLVRLAQLKMAFRLANAPSTPTTIEQYLNASHLQNIRKDSDFQGKIKDSYEKYGIAGDYEFLKNKGLFKSEVKSLNYNGESALRLDNQSASAAVLYLAMQDGKKGEKSKTPLDFNESDAAAVWALNKFSENQSGSMNRNLMSFNTQVCQMVQLGGKNDACGTVGGTNDGKRFNLKTNTAILEDYQAKSTAFEKQVSSAVEKAGENARLCFTEKCGEKVPVLRNDAVEAAKRALLKTMMSGPTSKKIDYANTHSVNGVITIRMMK